MTRQQKSNIYLAALAVFLLASCFFYKSSLPTPEEIAKQRIDEILHESPQEQRDYNSAVIERSGRETPTETPQSYAEVIVRERWDLINWEAFNLLIDRESNWDYKAQNPNSSALGLGQMTKGSRANCKDDYATNYKTQINCMVRYISSRFGTPEKALQHSNRFGWY